MITESDLFRLIVVQQAEVGGYIGIAHSTDFHSLYSIVRARR